MPSFPEIKQALRAQDMDEVLEIVPQFVHEEPDGFDQVLQQMMYLAATEQYKDEKPVGIVYLDAVRDLSTLYERDMTDAIPLMEKALGFFCTLSLEEFDKDLVGVKPEHFGESVFVGDLEDYVRDGERGKAIEEAAKLLRMMDNQFYLVEILAEIATSTAKDDGWPVILADAVLKSVDFVERSQFKPIVYQLADYLSRLDIGWQSPPEAAMHGPVFDEFYEAVLFSDSYENDLLYLTHAQQVWEGARMKEREVRENLSYWLDKQFGGSNTLDSIDYSPKSAEIPDVLKAIRDRNTNKSIAYVLGYLQEDGGVGTLFKSLTNLFFEQHLPENYYEVNQWNALRTAIAYTTPPQQYQAFVRAVELIV
ncbi:MAG: hypothetical protein MAGBODY4_00763 [Candidatus Marinimicrobia bacterium]|nr:hypothetical protein [Candidatus Neomarinimicrobiota bacterium]